MSVVLLVAAVPWQVCSSCWWKVYRKDKAEGVKSWRALTQQSPTPGPQSSNGPWVICYQDAQNEYISCVTYIVCVSCQIGLVLLLWPVNMGAKMKRGSSMHMYCSNQHRPTLTVKLIPNKSLNIFIKYLFSEVYLYYKTYMAAASWKRS